MSSYREEILKHQKTGRSITILKLFQINKHGH